MSRRLVAAAIAASLVPGIIAVTPAAAGRTGFANASCVVVGSTLSVNVDAYGIDSAPTAYLGTSRRTFSGTGTLFTTGTSYPTYMWYGVVLVPSEGDRYVKVTGRFGGAWKERILACR